MNWKNRYSKLKKGDKVILHREGNVRDNKIAIITKIIPDYIYWRLENEDDNGYNWNNNPNYFEKI